MFKHSIWPAVLALVIGVTPVAYALDIEVVVGGWQQEFGGTLGFNETLDANDILDIDNDLNFDKETRPTGRVKIDMPLVIPNIYVMAAPMKFEGTGSKSVVIDYGDLTIPADTDLDSEITLNQYDVAFYWGIPALKTATAGTFNIDLGLNVRWVDLEARLRAETTTTPGGAAEDEVSTSVPIPMLYVAFQITPVDSFAIEAEGRGVSVGDNKLYSVIGRVRYNFPQLIFVTGGYRMDKLEIDEDDVLADIEFSGPFIELGIHF